MKPRVLISIALAALAAAPTRAAPGDALACVVGVVVDGPVSRSELGVAGAELHDRLLSLLRGQPGAPASVARAIAAYLRVSRGQAPWVRVGNKHGTLLDAFVEDGRAMVTIERASPLGIGTAPSAIPLRADFAVLPSPRTDLPVVFDVRAPVSFLEPGPQAGDIAPERLADAYVVAGIIAPGEREAFLRGARMDPARTATLLEARADEGDVFSPLVESYPTANELHKLAQALTGQSQVVMREFGGETGPIPIEKKASSSELTAQGRLRAIVDLERAGYAIGEVASTFHLRASGQEMQEFYVQALKTAILMAGGRDDVVFVVAVDTGSRRRLWSDKGFVPIGRWRARRGMPPGPEQVRIGIASGRADLLVATVAEWRERMNELSSKRFDTEPASADRDRARGDAEGDFLAWGVDADRKIVVSQARDPSRPGKRRLVIAYRDRVVDHAGARHRATAASVAPIAEYRVLSETYAGLPVIQATLSAKMPDGRRLSIVTHALRIDGTIVLSRRLEAADVADGFTIQFKPGFFEKAYGVKIGANGPEETLAMPVHDRLLLPASFWWQGRTAPRLRAPWEFDDFMGKHPSKVELDGVALPLWRGGPLLGEAPLYSSHPPTLSDDWIIANIDHASHAHPAARRVLDPGFMRRLLEGLFGRQADWRRVWQDLGVRRRR